MCEIALIILATMGLCGGISIKGLSIGVLIVTGIHFILNVILRVLEVKNS